MRKILASLVVICFMTSSFASGLSSSPNNNGGPNAATIMFPVGKEGNKISLMDLSHMKIKEWESLTGKKLRLSDKIAFKLMQKQLKSSINNDGTVNQKKLTSLMPTSKKATEESRKWLKLWLIFLGVAIVLSIIGIFVPFMWILSGLAGLAAAVFFVLWIIAMAG